MTVCYSYDKVDEKYLYQRIATNTKTCYNISIEKELFYCLRCRQEGRQTMAKITSTSVKISTPVYPHKVLKDLLANGDFYISPIEGEDSLGMAAAGDVIVYGIPSDDRSLVQGFLVDADGLVLPYNCLTTWAANYSAWTHVNINEFMQLFPSSCMDEYFSDFKSWLNKVVEASL